MRKKKAKTKKAKTKTALDLARYKLLLSAEDMSFKIMKEYMESLDSKLDT